MTVYDHSGFVQSAEETQTPRPLDLLIRTNIAPRTAVRMIICLVVLCVCLPSLFAVLTFSNPIANYEIIVSAFNRAQFAFRSALLPSFLRVVLLLVLLLLLFLITNCLSPASK